MKFSTKNIAYIAIIAAVSVILNTLTLTMPGTGIAFSLTYIPNFLAGFFFGPGAGFIVGVVGDILGCILWSKGAWLPTLTLSAGLMGAIPGFIRMIPLKYNWIIFISYILTYAVCSLGINTTTFWFVYAAPKNKAFGPWIKIKVATAFLNMIANLVLNFLLMPVFNRLLLPRLKEMAAQKQRQEKTENNAQASTDDAACERGEMIS